MSVQTGTKKKEGGIAETIRVLINALIIALVIRTFPSTQGGFGI